MNCLRCDKEMKTKLGFVTTSYRYCKSCFILIIEKRFRKHVRKFHLKPKQRVVAKDALSRYFLERIVHVPLNILKRKVMDSDLVVSLDTIDDAVVLYLEHLFFAKKQSKQILSLFHCVTDEELSLYCSYKRLSFTPKKHALKEKVHVLEKQYPGTLHALQKSMVDLQGIL
jgi:hypothetical protein